MQVNPKAESVNLTLCILAATFFKVSMKPEDENDSPRSPFSCDTAIITDVAEVKPTVTGIEMKSIRTPKKKENL